MINAKMLGVVLAAFATGAFLASPELRAYASTIANDVICSGCVGTSDLAGNAVTTAKIKDGEVRTADIAVGAVAAGRIADGAVGTLKIADESIQAVDIAPDAVGASELQGVSRLIFDNCFESNFANGSVAAGALKFLACTVDGAEPSDEAVVTADPDNKCFVMVGRAVSVDLVVIDLKNICGTSQDPGSINASIVVYRG